MDCFASFILLTALSSCVATRLRYLVKMISHSMMTEISDVSCDSVTHDWHIKQTQLCDRHFGMFPHRF